jgi:hypothetical protein
MAHAAMPPVAAPMLPLAARLRLWERQVQSLAHTLHCGCAAAEAGAPRGGHHLHQQGDAVAVLAHRQEALDH